MKPLHKLCIPRDSVFDVSKRDTVLNLNHLVDGKIKEKEFFEENFVTDGMKTLLSEAFRRLSGKSEQALFKLTQAMGGGKTHNLITLGMLAKHPEFRAQVLPGLPMPKQLPPVRVVAFSGRETRSRRAELQKRKVDVMPQPPVAPASLANIMADKSNEDLLAMIAHPYVSSTEALDVARAELQKRKVDVPNIAHGRLSLGSFIKLSVIAAIGCWPVLAILYGLIYFLGDHQSVGGVGVVMLVFALWVITSAVGAVGSGFLAGLCGYPFYAWLCRQRGGIVLKGKFKVL